MSERIYSFIGLARKANRLLSGEDTCERAIKAGKVELIIIAEDASENTRKRFIDACNYRNVNIRIYGRKEYLGRFTGKNVRSVIAILEKNFSKRLIEMIDSVNN
ncbi:MAG: 50S ribosomal protein L7ae [Clostridiaceae bacterium]|nr:50S ribosomal protein L7ae [Clostridiaceae bacterium]